MTGWKLESFLLLVILFLSVSCQSADKKTDRQPAVAGQFYSGNREELKKNLKDLFSNAVPCKNYKDVLAIIAPHAGYIFSGEVAASSFNQIDPKKEYENIFIIGPSHHVAFEGASIYSQGGFITPLGNVKVNTELADQLIEQHSFFSHRTDAHKMEHALEVELPFLQYHLKSDFKIIPIVIGTQSPEICRKIADALKPFLNKKNLFVISTDFSHYPEYSTAVKVDEASVQAILTNVPGKLLESIISYESKGIPNLSTCLCGWPAVLTLMYMTEDNSDILYTHIQYKNSGDTEYGDKNRVVGYNAIAVSLKQEDLRGGFKIDEKDKKELLAIARKTVTEYIKGRKTPALDSKKYPKVLTTNCGAFVTLKKHGELRGCIGRFDANEPLYKVIQQMAIASSTQDYRFNPVEPDELKDIEIEISVLTPMKKIETIDEIQLGRHGIYIRKGIRSGTFLPQVAGETGWNKEEFLGHCARDKAGIGWDGWKDAELYVYEAVVFSEKDLQSK